MTPEGAVKRDCKKFLESFGPQVYQYWPVQTGYGKRGLDVFLCVRGRFIGVECKKPDVNEPTKFQGITMSEVVVAGGITLLVNDVQKLKDLFALCFPDLKPIL